MIMTMFKRQSRNIIGRDGRGVYVTSSSACTMATLPSFTGNCDLYQDTEVLRDSKRTPNHGIPNAFKKNYCSY